MGKNRSFTLIELLVVIAILGLLISIVLVAFKGVTEKARIAKALAFSSSLQHGLGADAVGVYEFDEGSGTTAFDLSGYGNNGTIYGPTFTDDTPHKIAGAGAGKYALRFDGVNDYVRVIDPVSLRVQIHTVEFWINFNSIGAGSSRPVLQKYGAGSDRAPGIWRHITYPQRLHWRYNPGNLGFNNVGPRGEGTDFNVNEWYHIVGVKEGTTLRFYVNGGFVASASVPDPITQGAGDFYLGASSNAPAVTIDAVRIYSRALTTMEIQKHYAQGLKKLKLAEK